MKRILAIMLCVCLLAGASCALAAQGDKLILRGGMDGVPEASISSLAYDGDALYILASDQTLYTFDDTLNAHALPIARASADYYCETPALVSDGDAIWLITVESANVNGEPKVKRVALNLLALGANGDIAFEKSVELKYDELIDFYSEYDFETGDINEFEYIREIRAPFMMGGKLLFTSYEDDGYTACVFDMASGGIERYAANDVIELVPYLKNEALLIERISDGKLRASALDPITGDTRALFTLNTDALNEPFGFAYDASGDNVYYQLKGELFKLNAMNPGAAAAVATLPLDQWSNCLAIITREGHYAAGDYSTVVRRGTNPVAQTNQKLTIYNPNNATVENAYYSFASEYSEVDLRVLSEVSDITQAVLSRDSSVDVYYLPINSREYSALFERGYLAELTQSEALSAYAGALYPGLQDMVLKGGELYAVPIELEIPAMLTVKRGTLERIGLDENELPTTWAEFFDFLKRLPDIMGAHPEISLFEEYLIADELRETLLNALINDYVLYLEKNEQAQMSFDTPILRELLNAFEQVDFDALGVPDSYNTNNTAFVITYGEETNLLSSYMNTTANTYSQNDIPLILGFSKNDAPRLRVNPYVLVVNPYSQNRELATRFAEKAASLITPVNRVHMCPDYNEPVRNEYFEMIMESEIYYLNTLKDEYAKAADAEKAQYMQLIDDQEKNIETYREYYEFEASPESIARYRKYAARMAAEEYFGMDEVNSVEFAAQIRKYLEGASDANAFINGIEDKLRMMMLEGV